jgi:hypothetical protein
VPARFLSAWAALVSLSGGPVHSTIRSIKFLFTAQLILAVLFVINLMTSPGEWWVQWAALGLGIAWVISLFRVVRALVLAGGLAALGMYLSRRR